MWPRLWAEWTTPQVLAFRKKGLKCALVRGAVSCSSEKANRINFSACATGSAGFMEIRKISCLGRRQ